MRSSKSKPNSSKAHPCQAGVTPREPSKSPNPDWVVGFDLSVASPGAVALPLHWRPGDWRTPKAWLLKTARPASADDLEGQLRRYAAVATWALGIVGGLTAEGKAAKAPTVRLFVEDYGYSKNRSSSVSKTMENGGIVKYVLHQECGLILQPVASTKARALLGGVPRKDPKPFIQDKLYNRCKAPRTWDENQVDAFVIANWGLSELGGIALTFKV